MRVVYGDLWEYISADSTVDAVCVPICWDTKRNGELIMGAGVALQAYGKYPKLAQEWGIQVEASSEPVVLVSHTYSPPDIIGVPTKYNPFEPSDIELIVRASKTLAQCADLHAYKHVALPRLGAGLGRLDWADVAPRIARFLDSRFVVVAPKRHFGDLRVAWEGV